MATPNPKEDWSSIPAEFRSALYRYFFECLKPGSATLAALENNYVATMSRFHPSRWQGAYAMAHLLLYHAPTSTWGSPETVAKFLIRNRPLNLKTNTLLARALTLDEDE